jgi:catechol 2,3-dioxygenase-like lactoylglutathione lyase family enzyme
VFPVSDEPAVPACACCEQPLTGGFIRLWPSTNIRVCYECLDWMNSQRDLQVERSGGPVQVVGHEPVFRVADVARAVEHYQRLGFKTEYHDQTYAFASFGRLTVHLAQDGGKGWPGYHPERHMTSVLYIHVEDAERLAVDWRAAGVTVEGPRNEDYGKREGQHVDPDGNLIRFGSPIPR